MGLQRARRASSRERPHRRVLVGGAGLVLVLLVGLIATPRVSAQRLDLSSLTSEEMCDLMPTAAVAIEQIQPTQDSVGCLGLAGFVPIEGGGTTHTFGVVITLRPSPEEARTTYESNLQFSLDTAAGSDLYEVFEEEIGDGAHLRIMNELPGVFESRVDAVAYRGPIYWSVAGLRDFADYRAVMLEIDRKVQDLLDSLVTPDASTTTVPPSVTDTCSPAGTVTDHSGEPMPGLRVQLLLSGEVADQRVTDAEGSFRFADIGDLADAFGFDPAQDAYEVAVVMRDAVEGAPRFEIRWGPQGVLPEIRRGPSLVEDDPACSDDFSLGAIGGEYTVVAGPADAEGWQSLAFAYQGIRRAHRYASEFLDVDLAMTPLPVFTYCEGNPPGTHGRSCGSLKAYFRGGFSSEADVEGPPFIAMNRAFSTGWRSRERPMNGEYHEFGHALMADIFGGRMPNRPNHSNHGGYVNPTSTDSWTEGFAEWYATQVSRHIDGNTRWWLYPVGGQVSSLEDDRKVADNGGRDEELAIAGILVDMVDGPGDYQAPTRRQVTITSVGIIPTGTRPPDGSEFIVAAEIRNDSAAEQRDIAVHADFGGFGGLFTSRVDGFAEPGVLAPGEVGLAVVPVPAGGRDEFESIKVVGFGVGDDDPLTHSPQEVLDAIVAYRSSSEHSAGNVMDAFELREALRAAFPAEGDAIDTIFANHGIFADTDPRNGTRDPTERIGVTSPDGTRIRTDAEPAAVFDTRIDTGAVASRALVQVLYPEPRDGLSYSYTAEPDPDTATISVAVPPADTGAVVRIVLRADGHLPIVLPDIDAEGFWRDADANDFQPFLEFAATLTPGDPLENAAAPQTPGDLLGGGGIPLLPLLTGAAALAGVAVWSQRRRRNTPPMAAQPTPDPPPPPPPPPPPRH